MKFLNQKSYRERFFWIGLTIILVFSTLVLLLVNISYKGKLIVTQQHEKMLITEIEDLKNSLTENEKLLESQPKLTSWDIKRLKKKGLQDPIKDIVADLMKHKELIPYKGVLGGTMGFYYENNIHILTPKWVFTYFEDGHIFGHMLLEYQVSNDGRISWRVIDSYLE
jgi:hypothetical protein